MAYRPQDQTVRAPRRANMMETKAWQPTGKLTKDINTNSNNRELQAERADVMIQQMMKKL